MSVVDTLGLRHSASLRPAQLSSSPLLSTTTARIGSSYGQLPTSRSRLLLAGSVTLRAPGLGSPALAGTGLSAARGLASDKGETSWEEGGRRLSLVSAKSPAKFPLSKTMSLQESTLRLAAPWPEAETSEVQCTKVQRVAASLLSIPRSLKSDFGESLKFRKSAAFARLGAWRPQVNPRVPAKSGMLARLEQLRQMAFAIHRGLTESRAELKVARTALEFSDIANATPDDGEDLEATRPERLRGSGHCPAPTTIAMGVSCTFTETTLCVA